MASVAEPIALRVCARAPSDCELELWRANPNAHVMCFSPRARAGGRGPCSSATARAPATAISTRNAASTRSALGSYPGREQNASSARRDRDRAQPSKQRLVGAMLASWRPKGTKTKTVCCCCSSEHGNSRRRARESKKKSGTEGAECLEARHARKRVNLDSC